MAERPEDLNLPNSIITKLIKDSLPSNVNVSKDARLAISKAASVFVLYSTSCANNFTMQSKRKMIGAGDVFEAMKEMDFEDFIEPLKTSLDSYRLNQKGKKEQSEKKKKEAVSEKPKIVQTNEEIEEKEEEEIES